MDMPIAWKRVILDLRHMRMGRAFYVLLPAAASSLVLAQGCSGDWSFVLPAVEAGVPDTRFESACTAWAQSSCAYQQRCFAAISFGWQSVDQCVARETLACELAAADENVLFDENRIRGCQYPDDCASEPPSCFPPGHAAAGRACLRNAACRSGVCLGGGGAALCGACYDCDAACPSDQFIGLMSCIGVGCVSGLKDGADCDPRRGLVCLWPADCIASHCIFPTLADCPL